MFCSNCGKEIQSGDRFCTGCGQKIIVDYMQISQEKTNESLEERILCENVQRSGLAYEDCEIQEEDYDVLGAFMQFFGTKNIYGRDVYIFGVDMIPDGLEEELIKEFKIEDDEEPLLAFDQKNYFERGFLLTDRRFYWKDNLVGNNVWELDDICDVNKEKRILANVIYFVDWKNNVSQDVYLTGIEHVHEFVFAFVGFIRKLSGEDNFNTNSIDRIAEACLSVSLEMASGCVYGNPINSSNPKLNKVRKFFGIPNDESIFIILDSTVFGSGKSGFAIGADGIYYCLFNEQGKISWDEFRKAAIKKGFSSIKIGELDFTCSVGVEQNGLYSILSNLKSVV